MEPGHEDRKEHRSGSSPRHRRPCRNGARSRGPGRVGCAATATREQIAAMEPGHEDREEASARGPTAPGGSAAMEPGHEDREERRDTRAATVADVAAAMEPGHEDREEHPSQVVTLALHEPQWSPVTRTGKSCTHPWPCMQVTGRPQWSPVTRTGKRARVSGTTVSATSGRNGARSRGPGRGPLWRATSSRSPAAMEPGHEDREEDGVKYRFVATATAAMEPGHEDREEQTSGWWDPGARDMPQWSPVTRTGEEHRLRRGSGQRRPAAMEPGHEDREEQVRGVLGLEDEGAAMEPGHEDREESR